MSRRLVPERLASPLRFDRAAQPNEQGGVSLNWLRRIAVSPLSFNGSLAQGMSAAFSHAS
jgi:hypothetical protein